MTDFTVTLGKPDLDPEEKRARALRAREVLDGASWLFDEVISDLTRDLLSTQDRDKREQLFHQIDATAQVKGHLKRILEQQSAAEKINEQRNRNDPPADHA